MKSRENKKAKSKASPRGAQATSTQATQAAAQTAGKVIPLIKYDDVGRPLESGKLNLYWQSHPTLKIFPTFRSSTTALPRSYRFWDHRFLMAYYGLAGWEFGNWASQEDRQNYVCAMGIALFDMKRVLRIPAKEVGMAGKITIAIAARGIPKALAHFEPTTFAINISRYKRQNWKPKKERFLETGGAGSFAHEYGHALDYFFGGYVDQDPNSFALSGGRSVRTKPEEKYIDKPTFRGQMERVIRAIIWEKEGKQTAFYARLRQSLKEAGIKSDYFYRRNELFARVFEQYISYKLAQKGDSNTFLSKKKYDPGIYLPKSHLKKVAPIIDRLIDMMRREFRS